ncbi:MAG: permease [Beijerinckiaceae bacterium]
MSVKRPIIDWTFVLVAALSISAAIFVYLRDGQAAFTKILWDDILLLLAILPKVAAGCLIGAMVRLLIPRKVIVEWVGEGSGLRGLLIASGVGALFPGGPFTIFPLAGAFMLSGADRGAAVAFVTGWLLLGINRAIIWEMPFFGTDFVMLRMGLSLIFPVLAGLLARWLGRAIDNRFPEKPAA